MAISIKHAYTASGTNDATKQISVDRWNADLTTSMTPGKLAGSSPAGPGTLEEITIGSGLSFSGTTLSFSGYTNLFQPDANTLDQRNGANPQSRRVYNFYTDASNYERGVFRYASNVLEIGTEAAGTGTARKTKIIGDQLIVGSGYGFGAPGDLSVGRGGDSAAIFLGDTGSAFLFYAGGNLSLSGMGLSMTGPSSAYNIFRRDNNAVVWAIYSQTGDLQFASVAGGADKFILKSDGTLIQRPPSSATPPSNGDLVVEATSNTTLTFKLKGSDGTVRSGTITLS